MFKWLKELLKTFTWKEFWISVSIPTIVVGFWILFSQLLSIQNDIIRTAAIWLLIFVLSILGGATEASWKRGVEKH